MWHLVLMVFFCIYISTLSGFGCSEDREGRNEEDRRALDTMAEQLQPPRDDGGMAPPKVGIVKREITMAEQPQPPRDDGGLVPPKIKIERKKITIEAIELAGSLDKVKHEQLRTLLTDEDYLQRLNTAQEYIMLSPEYLQLNFILEALSENPDRLGPETIDFLAGRPLYQEPGPRQTALLMTSGKITTAPTNIQQLWKDQLVPEADELNLTVEMLIANGSPEAIGIFENALLTHNYDQDYVIAWLQEHVLTHRHDLHLLESCKRLLELENWPGELKTVLVEVLFDYRPQDWYLMENEPPKPPDRDTLSPASRQKLIEIADLALNRYHLDKDRHSKIKAELRIK